MWKLNEETRLMYRSAATTIDTISALSQTYFVTGSGNSAVELWSAKKKKPLFALPRAHASDWVCSMVRPLYA